MHKISIRVVWRGRMHNGKHPVRKLLRSPDAWQATLRIRCQQGVVLLLQEGACAFNEGGGISKREIHSLAPSRGDDMGSISRQIHASILHWLTDKTAQIKETFLDQWAAGEGPGFVEREPGLQFHPNPLI